MLRVTLLAALAVVAASLMGGTAAATTAAECQQQIQDLRVPTAAATFTSRQADRDLAGLDAKLVAASDALPKKPGTAIQKLTDYRSKVEQLLAAGKLSSDVDLVQGANDAIACVQALGT